MDEFTHPSVVVGVDSTIHGLAALRTAVDEARRRQVPLHAVRCHNPVQFEDGPAIIGAALHDALGSIPGDVEIHAVTVVGSLTESLVSVARDPRDLIVVGNSGKSAFRTLWSGSVVADLVRSARCPVLAVPAPEMARAVSVRKAVRTMHGDLWQQFDQTVPQLSGPRHIDS